ncbi:Med8p [Sugiyamaella lignohabitans]|uniref:Mediator of RNA polymerase II transcription subunit 8 n=1 Tax=Sugiyamaella lignohabitans TaxID=796027 RepID=A0A167FE12_9ASCO|nr:Med8p [Sugiyamaella lignohabitans]ANB15182.1 Med8p [Sugiyamaella lignohabitans]
MDTAQSSVQPDLSGVPVTALESLRLRLAQLTHSLNSLQAQIQQASLPSWPALQGQLNVILTQLTSLSATVSGYAETLQRTVAYPLPNFPTNTEAGLLTTLLRKKNLPEVDDWIAEGKEIGEKTRAKQDGEFCSWAAKVVDECRQDHEWSGFLSRKDIENGLEDEGLNRNKTSPTAGPSWTNDETIIFLSRGEIPARFQKVDESIAS